MFGVRLSSLRACRLRVRSARLTLVVGFLVMAAASFAADTFLFGPQTFQGTGSGVLTTRSFNVTTGGDGYVLRVRNNGVTLAIVGLNSQVVLRPQDFGAVFPTSGSEDWRTLWDRLRRELKTLAPGTPAPLIEKPVSLRTGRNDLVIAFIAPKGKSFTLEVVRPGATDTTPPVITTSMSPPPNGSAWSNTPVTVTFTCSDSGSGVATCPAAVMVSTEGQNQVVYGTAIDNAGNRATASVTLNIDVTPPVVATAQAPLANVNGWNNTPVEVSFFASDVLSGVAPGSVTAPVALSTDGTNLSASGQALDLAGNVGRATRSGINIDQIPPTVAVVLSPSPNADGWNNSTVSAHFACSDAGSGIASCPPDQSFPNEGADQHPTGTISDLAGNTGSVSGASINIDLTPPVIQPSLSPPLNGAGWANTPVTVSFSCADSLSGVAVCPPAQTVGQPGAGQLVTGTASDRAGNTGTASATVSLDAEPPTFTWTAPPGGATVTSSPVSAAATVTDGLSGIVFATCNGTAAAVSGSTLTCSVSLTPGSNSIIGTVTDAAGNTGSATLVLTYAPPVVPTITDFNPKTVSAGALVTLVGINLSPNPRVTVARLGGGTVDAMVAESTPTSVSFVVPPGAATGPITVVVGPDSAVTGTPLTIATSSEFDLNVSPVSANLIAGQSISMAVTLTSTNGFGSLADLSVSGLPSGTSASFAPERITTGQVSILTVTAPVGQAATSAALTITASANVEGLVLTRTSVAQLAVSVPTTSLVGRIVVADTLEAPLAGVTVTLLGKNGNGGLTSCSGATVSDAAGNFALTGLGAACVGPQLVGYDGLTATSPPGRYAGVNLLYTLAAEQVTASPVLVHLPRIDDKETFMVQQNAPTDQTYRYRSIPGLSVTVYAGTTFTLENGTRPDPFPLVAVQVPVDRLPDAKPPVPTMLNAFIVAFQPANAVASQPAAVFYPNTLKTAPGVNMTMMTLDPTLGRMVPYGTATVSAGGSQIVPDLDPAHAGHRYGIVHFDWHGPMPPPPPPPQTDDPINGLNPGPGGGGCPGGGGGSGGGGGGGGEGGGGGDGGGDAGGGGPDDGSGGGCTHSQEPACSSCSSPTAGPNPVDVASGLETVVRTDLAIRGGRGGIAIRRNYRTLSTYAGPFGIGTHHNYGYRLDRVNVQNAQLINLVTPDGNRFPFTKETILSADDIGPLPPNELRNFTDPSMFGAVMTVVSDTNIELRWKDGTVYRFASPIPQFTPQLQAIVDPNGNAITITRNPNNPNQVTQVTDPVGRSLSLAYDGANRVVSISDPIGRSVQYAYNAQGTLETVRDPEGGITRYEYDTANRMVRETNARGIPVTVNTYDADGRVIRQVAADGGTFTYTYTKVNPLIESSPLLSTTVTDPLGRQRVYRFNTNGYLTDVRRADGLSVVTSRDPRTNHPVGQETAGILVAKVVFERDSRGNITRRTDSYGRSTTYTRHPQFNGVTSVTDPLGHTTSFTYDARGNLLTRTDSNGNSTSYRYDVRGQLTATTDALGRTTRFAYDGLGNLASMTDALGNVTRFGYDGISRLTEIIDPIGRRTRTEHDRLGRVVRQIDPRGNATAFGYDAVGNLTSVTDARGKVTSFTYDGRNRLISRTDPVGRSETRIYDLMGNLTLFTDRRGMTSTYVYDALNRLREEHYADGASVVRSYDAASRLTRVSDSASGDFTFLYDLENGLLASHGPTGTVLYARDELERVRRRQVAGQPALDYAFDAAGNLTSASMPGASVTFVYDQLNRPQTLNRENGVRSDYTYDPVGRLLSIVHARGTTTLAALSYSYDAAGARVGQQSTAAQPLATQLSGVTTFDDANRLIQRDATTYAYDENGNLTSEVGPGGNTTYVWDARNRLARLIQPNGQRSEFTYDFVGLMIRQASSGPIINLTRAFALDEMTNTVFQQSSDGGQLSVLRDRQEITIGSSLYWRRRRGTVPACLSRRSARSMRPCGRSSQSARGGCGPPPRHAPWATAASRSWPARRVSRPRRSAAG